MAVIAGGEATQPPNLTDGMDMAGHCCLIYFLNNVNPLENALSKGWRLSIYLCIMSRKLPISLSIYLLAPVLPLRSLRKV